MTDSAAESGVRRVNGASVVILPSEISIANREDVSDLLLKAVGEYRTVIVDLRANEHCDSSGISVLVSAAKRARASGGDVLIVVTEPARRRIFKVTGVDRFLRIFATVDAAIATEPQLQATRRARTTTRRCDSVY